MVNFYKYSICTKFSSLGSHILCTPGRSSLISLFKSSISKSFLLICFWEWYGLLWWLSGKESACNAGDAGDSGSIPRLGRSPREEHDNPLQYSCLENPMDRGAWQAKGLPRVRHDWSVWACTHENDIVKSSTVVMNLSVSLCNSVTFFFLWSARMPAHTYTRILTAAEYLSKTLKTILLKCWSHWIGWIHCMTYSITIKKHEFVLYLLTRRRSTLNEKGKFQCMYI